MKQFFLSLAVLATSVVTMAQTPAFPGAEGHGRYVTGHRGASNYTIVHVTNLNDSGTGSFRAAVTGGNNRLVVFDVAGIIELKSDLQIKSNITIAGQTAPDPGITVRYRTIRPGANNVIRFIRFRRGEEKDVNDGADAIWQTGKNNIILDHCSFSWSIDEIASFYDNKNFTMQWCTLGEALANPGHSKGEHSYGGIWGGKDASFHHNMIIHVQNRAPRFCGARYASSNYDKTKYANPIQAERVDFRNCVMYNWGTGNGCYGGTGGGQINIINNYYKAGPATSNKTRVTQVSVATESNAEGSPYMGYSARYYINGNYVTAALNPQNYDWNGVIYDNGVKSSGNEKFCPDANHLYGDGVTYTTIDGVDCVPIKMSEPVDAGEVTTHSAETAYDKVLSYCGASLYRDAVDKRYVKETSSGTYTHTGSAQPYTYKGKTYADKHYPGIIDYVADQGTYTLDYVKRSASWDADDDGMADEWEQLNGGDLDPRAYTVDSEKKYSNIEVYINSLVEDIMKAGNADALSSVDEYYPECVKLDIANSSGVETPVTLSLPIATEYYTVDGRRLAEPQRGINIRVERMANGQNITTKVTK